MSPTPPTRRLIIFIVYLVLLVSTAVGQNKNGVEADIAKCWSYRLSNDPGSAFAAHIAAIYVAAADGKVEAVSHEGKKLWQSEFGGDISSNLLPLETGL